MVTLPPVAAVPIRIPPVPPPVAPVVAFLAGPPLLLHYLPVAVVHACSASSHSSLTVARHVCRPIAHST
eukprot:1022665-Prorocentrum_minimum.AAC.1